MTIRLVGELPRNYVPVAKKARPSGVARESDAPFAGWKQPPELAGEPAHALRQLLPPVLGLEQFVGDLERREDRRLVRLDGRACIHDTANRLVDVLGDRARMLGRLIAADRILLADEAYCQAAVAVSLVCLTLFDVVCWAVAFALTLRAWQGIPGNRDVAVVWSHRYI